MKHPLADHPPGTVFHLVNTYISRNVDLSVNLHLLESETSDDDLIIAERIIKAFLLARRHESDMNPDKIPNQGVWEMVKHAYHGEAYRLLLSGEVEPLARYLTNALRTTWGFGLGPGPAVFEAFSTEGEPRDANVLIVKDRLVSLSVALGILSQETSEQGRYGENIHINFAELAHKIEESTSMKIGVLPIMGAFGVSHDNRIIDARTSEDVYASLRIRSLSPRGVVGEIGGGFGGTSLQFVRAGLATTVFDLPIINALQAYFLIKSIGHDHVALYGEHRQYKRASVLPWWCIFNPDVDFDIVFNRDSFAEIPYANAIEYLYEIKRRRISFLSINQETEAATGQEGISQLSTSKLAKQANLRRTHRFPYWIRRGYVEEVFVPENHY